MTAPGPRFSILMASYNPGRYLLPAVESALEQLAAGDELLVQDACSTDGSVEALLERHGSDPRLKIVREPDDGQADGLQRALDRAANEFIGWLNADDAYYLGALDVVRAAAAGTADVDVVYGAATVFDQDDRVLRRSVPADFSVDGFLRHGCHVFSGAAFLRTDVVRDAGGFDSRLHYAMDFDLFFRVAERARRTVRVPEFLGGLRWHGDSKTGTVRIPFFRESFRIRMSHARTAGERLRIVVQMAFRLAALPLLPLRNSRAFARLNRVKRFASA